MGWVLGWCCWVVVVALLCLSCRALSVASTVNGQAPYTLSMSQPARLCRRLGEPGCWRRWSVPGNTQSASQPASQVSQVKQTPIQPSIHPPPITPHKPPGKRKENGAWRSEVQKTAKAHLSDRHHASRGGKRPRHPTSKPQTQPKRNPDLSCRHTHHHHIGTGHVHVLSLCLFRVQMEVDLEFCFSFSPSLCFFQSHLCQPHLVSREW